MTPQRENRDLKKAPPRPPPLAFRAPLKLETLVVHRMGNCVVCLIVGQCFDWSMNLGQKAIM